MTPEQLNQLIAGLTDAVRGQIQGGQGAGDAAAIAAGAAASVVGRLGPCELGRDKLKRYKKFIDWISEAESKMRLLQVTTNAQKISFIQSCAGPDLTTFWDKEARVRWEAVGEDAAHTYPEIVQESKETLLKYVSRDRAIIDLLHIPQGDKTVTEFLAEVEDQASLCRVADIPITEDDLKRLALIAGFKDRALAEKCLGEEYTLLQVISTAVTRESSTHLLVNSFASSALLTMRKRESVVQ